MCQLGRRLKSLVKVSWKSVISCRELFMWLVATVSISPETFKSAGMFLFQPSTAGQSFSFHFRFSTLKRPWAKFLLISQKNNEDRLFIKLIYRETIEGCQVWQHTFPKVSLYCHWFIRRDFSQNFNWLTVNFPICSALTLAPGKSPGESSTCSCLSCSLAMLFRIYREGY